MGATCPKCSTRFQEKERKYTRGMGHLPLKINAEERPDLTDEAFTETGTGYQGANRVWEYTCPECGHRFLKIEGGQHGNIDAPVWD